MKSKRLFLLASVALYAPIASLAGTYSGPDGGEFTDPANWTPAAFPSGGDIVISGKTAVSNGTLTSGGRLLMNLSVNSSASLTIQSGTLTIAGNDYSSANYIGVAATGGTSSLILAGGNLTTAGAVASPGAIRVVANGSSNATGIVRVDSGSTLDIAGSYYTANVGTNCTVTTTIGGTMNVGTMAVAGMKDLHLTQAGSGNRSSMTVNSGGAVTVAGNVTLANAQGTGVNTAEMTVAGAVTSTAGNIYLSGIGNAATLTINSGGSVRATSAAAGGLIFTNQNSTTNLVLNAGSTLAARYTTFGQAAGSSEMNVVVEYDPNSASNIDFGLTNIDSAKVADIKITIKFVGDVLNYNEGESLTLWYGRTSSGVSLTGATFEYDFTGITGGTIAGTLDTSHWSNLAGSYMAFNVASVTAIPEPSTYALIAGGLALGLAVAVRRRKTK